MSKQPILSIITPVFNGAEVISETIESVIGANCASNFEYIVIDDGSSDKTLEILERYKDSISIITQENSGESATVNRGLEIAKGKYILVISADDPLLTGELIDIGVANLEASPELVAVYPDWQIIDKSGNIIEQKYLPEYSDEVLIAQNRTLLGPGSIFRKDDARAIGGRNPKWKFVGDYDFWLRLSRRGKISHIPKLLAQWRSHPESTSVSQKNLQMALERIGVISEFVNNQNLDEKLARRAVGNSYILAARLVFFDSTIPGRLYLWKSLKVSRGWPSEAKFHIVAYILLLPFSRFFIRDVLGWNGGAGDSKSK